MHFVKIAALSALLAGCSLTPAQREGLAVAAVAIVATEISLQCHRGDHTWGDQGIHASPGPMLPVPRP